MSVPGDRRGGPVERGHGGSSGRETDTSAGRWVRYGRGTALVFEFTGTIAAGALLGHLLDRKFNSEPWFMIVLTLAGVVGGFVRLVQVVERLERRRD
jgi:F0F1-type ATP synthase assembly protein I